MFMFALVAGIAFAVLAMITMIVIVVGRAWVVVIAGAVAPVLETRKRSSVEWLYWATSCVTLLLVLAFGHPVVIILFTLAMVVGFVFACFRCRV